MSKGFQVIGDSINPFHLSVGAVITEDSKVLLIRKADGVFTLPRETMYSQQSLEESLTRGVQEELGVIVKVERFLGALISHFNRPDNTDIEKTTLYLLTKRVNESLKEQEDDELEDEVVYLELDKAIETLKSQGNEEYKILERVL